MSELFQKAFIGSMELRNHFVRSATWEGMAGENGEVTEPLIEIYRDLAKGGVGLILTGYSFGGVFQGLCRAIQTSSEMSLDPRWRPPFT
ncbi:MAG: hypothetical protein AB1325_11850 [Nitrospirota bacterium]